MQTQKIIIFESNSYKNDAWIYIQQSKTCQMNSFYGIYLQDLKIFHISAKYDYVKYLLEWLYTPPSSPLLPSTKWIFFLYCEQKVGSSLSLRSIWIIDLGFSSLYKSSILSEFRGGEWVSSNIIFQYNALYVPATALPFLFTVLFCCILEIWGWIYFH